MTRFIFRPSNPTQVASCGKLDCPAIIQHSFGISFRDQLEVGQSHLPTSVESSFLCERQCCRSRGMDKRWNCAEHDEHRKLEEWIRLIRTSLPCQCKRQVILQCKSGALDFRWYSVGDSICQRSASGKQSSVSKNLAVINDKVIFDAYADTNSDRYLFVSDGTAAGTQILVGFSGVSTISQIAVASGIGFVARDNGLTRTDGTLSGTFSLGPFSSVTNLANVNGTRFFSASTSGTGTELWKSDGTVAGTVLVKDIQSAPVVPRL